MLTPVLTCMTSISIYQSACINAVYTDVHIDKGNATLEVGSNGPTSGKVGSIFFVPIGKRTIMEDSGGFLYNGSTDPPLPAKLQWFKDMSLLGSSHGNKLHVDVRSMNDSGIYECRATSRIVEERGRNITVFQKDFAISNVTVIGTYYYNRHYREC